MASAWMGVCRAVALLACASWLVDIAGAAEIGQIKRAKGQVTVERGGQTLPGAVGTRLQTSDVVRTGADSAVGITMDDDALLSAGPGSVLALDRYAFEPTTGQGRFDASLNKGTLAVISGRIAKQSRDAMTVRTPTAILGVRGTEFAVSADD
ncbi:MAG: FecR family protein [Casimicrobiaceae bacterium]